MLNTDLSKKIVIETAEMAWLSSPSGGVLRKPLEKEATESGRTSSIVEYQKGSAFPEHSHPHGEEIFVLEGIFSDEHGDYPAGTYIRNPPGSSHSPFSIEGCMLLVKLDQFANADAATIRIDTKKTPWLPGLGGLQVMPLHEFEHEHVALVKWPKGEHFQPHSHFGGEEVFVLSGEFCDEHGKYSKHCWIRSPHMSKHNPFVEQESVIFVKTGHLPPQ